MDAFEDIPFVTVDIRLQGAFRTHLHYLEAFAKLATDSKTKIGDAYKSVATRFAWSRDMPTIGFKMRDVQQVKRSLQSAWGTELLLYLGHKFLKSDEIVRLSNTWNVVQAYYAVYHATQAIAAARGFPRPDTHPKTQKVFLDFWGRLPDCFTPWCLSFGANGHKPSTIRIIQVHNWTPVDDTNCSSLACKALRTTREDFCGENYKKMRDSKQKLLRKEWNDKEKKRIESGKRPRPEPNFHSHY